MYCLYSPLFSLGLGWKEDAPINNQQALVIRWIRILEKDVPMEPEVRRMTMYPNQETQDYMVCAKCHQWVLEKESNYCGNCGQAVKRDSIFAKAE